MDVIRMHVIHNITAFFDQWNYTVILVRILLSVTCGGAIGLSRSVKRINAGFKTHSLVCMGSALIMLTGEYIFETFGDVGDISRLPAQVISGVGFLGAGTIIVTGKAHVKGLTTAAGLWVCAGIGIAFGIGFYSGGLIATGLILILYNFMDWIDVFARNHARVIEFYIEFANRRSVANVLMSIKQMNFKVEQIELAKPSKKEKCEIVNATITVSVPRRMQHDLVAEAIGEIEGVEYVEEL